MHRRMGASAMELDASSDGSGSTRWRAIVAERLPGEGWPPRAVLVTAVNARTGEPVVFDRHSGVDILDAVAASTASGSPYRIGADRYIQRGYRRNENADLAAGFARRAGPVTVTARGPDTPSAGVGDAHAGAGGRQSAPGGSRVETIVPDTESLAAFGTDLMDPSTRTPAARAGEAQGRDRSGQIGRFWGWRHPSTLLRGVDDVPVARHPTAKKVIGTAEARRTSTPSMACTWTCGSMLLPELPHRPSGSPGRTPCPRRTETLPRRRWHRATTAPAGVSMRTWFPASLHPPSCCTTALGQGIADGGQPSVGGVVRLPVVRGDDDAVHRRSDPAAEAGEALGRFCAQQRAERDGGGATLLVDGDEVDGVRGGEEGGAVAWDPVGRTVPGQPAALERVGEVDARHHVDRPGGSEPPRASRARTTAAMSSRPCPRRSASGRGRARRRAAGTRGPRREPRRRRACCCSRRR